MTLDKLIVTCLTLDHDRVSLWCSWEPPRSYLDTWS